jgi:hypothetical protein
LSGAALATLFVVAGHVAQAQDKGPKKEPIVTDRPDFTEASTVVGKGVIQFEGGFTYSADRGGSSSLSGPEALFRFGVSDRLEWRLALPDFNWGWGGGGVLARGFGDTYAGAKIQLGPTRGGIDVAIIPAVFISTGQRSFTSRGIDPEIKLVASKELSEKHALSGMLYFSNPTEPGRRNFTTQATLSLGTSLTDKMAFFVEYAGTFPQYGRSSAILHTGVTYQLTHNLQFDIHGGVGAGQQSPHSFIAGGLAVRY